MESKNLGEILKKWSGINLKEDPILIIGKNNTKYETPEDAVNAGEFQATFKRASNLVIEDLNGLMLKVTEKDDLKDLYNFLKSWFGDSDKPLKKNELSNIAVKLEDLKIEIEGLKANSKRPTISNNLKNKIFKYYKDNSISKNQLAKDLGIAYPTIINIIKKFE
jgi:hypothetical protein